MPALSQPAAHLAGELGRKRSFADTGCIGLGDAEHAADGPRPDAESGADATDRRVRRSDVGIRAVIDVEQRSLCAFEENRSPLPHRVVEHQRDVADPRPHALAVLHQPIEHRPPVHRVVLDEAVAGGHVVADVLLEATRIGEIADADAAPRDLVLVGRPDAARGRPEFALAAARLRQQIQIAMVGQDEVGLVADEDTGSDIDAGLRELVHLRKERLGIDHHAVADDAGDARMKNSGRNQPQNELRALDVHGVAGVVAALIPGHDRKMRGQQVDDLALAFVSPLRAKDCKVHILELRFYSTVLGSRCGPRRRRPARCPGQCDRAAAGAGDDRLPRDRPMNRTSEFENAYGNLVKRKIFHFQIDNARGAS